MGVKQDDRTAQGTNARNRNRGPSQGASQDASTSHATAPQAAPTGKVAGRKKAAAKNTTKKAAPKRTSKKAAPKRRVTEEERHHMIEEAAYFRAEKQGFGCDPWKNWLDAEAEIDARLANPR